LFFGEKATASKGRHRPSLLFQNYDLTSLIVVKIVKILQQENVVGLNFNLSLKN
jgi:hypothetical protein